MSVLEIETQKGDRLLKTGRQWKILELVTRLISRFFD